MRGLLQLRSGLAGEIRAFDPECPIETATPPPASWYLDPAFLELERHTTFAAHWQFVGRTDQLQGAGDYFTGSVAQRPFVVVRDRDGELRAFYNVCSHHGTRVAADCGTADRFTCPYHGWEYDLSGALKRAPRAGAVAALRERQAGLRPIPVATWGPFVLLYFGAAPPDPPDPPDPAVRLQPEAALLDFDGLRFVTRRTYELPCNWKVFVDNYLDGGYHVPHLHPALAAALDLDSYASRLGDGYSVQTCAARPAADRVGGLARYLWVHPNFMINRYGAWMDTNLVLPLAADRCLAVFDYFHDGDVDESTVQRALAESDQVQREDMAVVCRVQEGLASGVYGGLYASRFEAPMLQFHRLLAADYSG